MCSLIIDIELISEALFYFVILVGRFMYILTVQVFKHTYRGLRGCLLSFLQVLIIQILVFDLVIVRGITPDITIILSLVCGVLRHFPYNLVY